MPRCRRREAQQVDPARQEQRVLTSAVAQHAPPASRGTRARRSRRRATARTQTPARGLRVRGTGRRRPGSRPAARPEERLHRRTAASRTSPAATPHDGRRGPPRRPPGRAPPSDGALADSSQRLPVRSPRNSTSSSTATALRPGQLGERLGQRRDQRRDRSVPYRSTSTRWNGGPGRRPRRRGASRQRDLRARRLVGRPPTPWSASAHGPDGDRARTVGEQPEPRRASSTTVGVRAPVAPGRRRRRPGSDAARHRSGRAGAPLSAVTPAGHTGRPRRAPPGGARAPPVKRRNCPRRTAVSQRRRAAD